MSCGALKVTEGQFVVKYKKGDGDRMSTFPVKIDFSQPPKHIDILNSRVGKTETHGIVKLEGGKLTICLDSRMAERPTAFESKPGTEMQLLVFSRASPGAPSR